MHPRFVVRRPLARKHDGISATTGAFQLAQLFRLEAHRALAVEPQLKLGQRGSVYGCQCVIACHAAFQVSKMPLLSTGELCTTTCPRAHRLSHTHSRHTDH